MPVEMPDPDALEARAAESILGDPGLRDELTDAEAQPLIDWGLKQAAAMVRRAVAGTAAPFSPEALDESLGSLSHLMRRINRLVGNRAAGDVDRIRQDLDRLARLSEQLYGGAAARLEAVHMETFLTEQARLSNGQVVTRLLEMFAPPPADQLTAPSPSNQLPAPPGSESLASPEPPD